MKALNKFLGEEVENKYERIKMKRKAKK